MLQTYYWELPRVGKAVATAESVAIARTQVLDVLDKDDGAREELAQALQAEPKNITSMRFTMVDFVDGL